MRDLTDRANIKVIIDDFYEKVWLDDLLEPIFSNAVEKSKFQGHLETMYDFWESVLFGGTSYKGNPFVHHVKLPVEKKHFDRWLKLFEESINTHYKGKKADETILRDRSISYILESKLAQINDGPTGLNIFKICTLYVLDI